MRKALDLTLEKVSASMNLRSPEAACRACRLAMLLVLVASPAAGQAPDSLPRVLPVDEASQHPVFFAFRARLQRAIIERDTAALLEVLDPTIKLTFGGDSGVEEFRRIWLESPGHDIWVELGAVLALGGRFSSDSIFYAPYTFHPFTGGVEPAGYDPFAARIALGDAVPVLDAPYSTADTLAVLSFHVVEEEWRSAVADPPAGWTAVRLSDGALGFARSDEVRSPIDYRAGFALRDGRWRLVMLIAGD